MIIFNEKEYVEKNYLKKDFLIKTSEELNAIIRYYTFKGKNILEVRDIIKNMKRTRAIDIYLYDDYIFTGVFIGANSRPLRTGEPIWITKYEYEFVKQIGDSEKEKIVFMFLVLKKILGTEHVVIPLKEIKHLSMTQKNYDGIKKALLELEEIGIIKKQGEKDYKILTDNLQTMKSQNYIYIDNFECIVVPYLRTIKTEDYFFCERCGRKTLYNKDDMKNGKSRKYCKSCSLKVKNHVKK